MPTPVATPIASGSWRFTVLKAGRTKTLQREGFVALEASGAWVVVHVAVHNLAKAAAVLPLKSIAAVDGAGQRYAISSQGADHYALSNKLPRPGDALPAGAQVDLAFVYAVPATASGFRLSLPDAPKEIPLGF